MFHEHAQEVVPPGAFPGGIKLRGYKRPTDNELRHSCTGHKSPDVSDMDLVAAQIMEKHGFKAYTIEVYFSHSPPMISRSSASSDADEFAIVYADLDDLPIKKIEMIEMIQIEYTDGEVYEFSDEEIAELKTVFTAMQRGGFAEKSSNVPIIHPMMWN
jgi:hypothetical protein